MPARSSAGRTVAPVLTCLLLFVLPQVTMSACQGSPARPTPAPCTYALTAPTAAFDAGGGTGSLGVSTAAGCAWTSTSQAPWIVIVSGEAGSGPGTIAFRVEPNAEVSDRTGTVNVVTQSSTIRQAGLTCTYAIDATTTTFAAAGGTATVNVSAPAACAWTAACTSQWVDILSGAEGQGDGHVTFAVAPHTGSDTRTTSVSVAGLSVAIVQSPTARCDVRISPSAAAFGAAGGTGGFDVTAPRDCHWAARSDVSFVEITAPRNGESDGHDRVAFTVAANAAAGGRSGSIRVGDARFTIDQAGMATCNYSVSPTEIDLDFTGWWEGRITVETSPGCPWTAACDASWIRLLDPPSAAGPGVMRYHVDQYTGAATRRDAIRFRWPTPTEGQNVWITQTGCFYTLNPDRVQAAAGGGQWTVNVYAAPVNQNTMRECSWKVTAEAPWLHATPSLGYGFDRLRVVVDPNPSSSPREGTVLVERVRLTVWQAGAAE